MPLQNSIPPENSATQVPDGVLSDEEIRSRAAAYAQKIYEQQLEVYEAQRAQALAMLRAHDEYIRRQAEYEEACRAYYARQQEAAGATAVRVDVETGEQVYTESLPKEFQANEAYSNEESDPVAQIVLDESGAEEAAFPAFEEAGGAYATDPFSEAPTTEEPDDGNANFFAPEENPVPGESAFGEPETTSPEEEISEAALPKEYRFPTFAVFIAIVCVSGLSAIGYILFSGDPRFAPQREHFFSVIGLKNENASGSGETDSGSKSVIPDFARSKPEQADSESEPEILPPPDEELPAENAQTEDEASLTDSAGTEENPDGASGGEEAELADEDDDLFANDDELFND